MDKLILEDGDRVIVRTGDVKFTTDIRTRDHELVADEPFDKDGQNEGPTAYDLLLAALGSCTSITLRMYAAHKGWDLGDITVRLRHEKIHAEDCKECEKVTGRIDRIERMIDFSGDLSDEQKERLLYIADRCPVHKTLKGPIVIATSLTEPAGP
jgi:putative redox protein